MLWHSTETARVKREEGGDDVKSSWPLYPGLHTCYNGRYKGMQSREKELIPKNRPQFGSQSATRLREAGIASNRGSACRGEYVPAALYTPPVTPWESVVPEVSGPTRKGGSFPGYDW